MNKKIANSYFLVFTTKNSYFVTNTNKSGITIYNNIQSRHFRCTYHSPRYTSDLYLKNGIYFKSEVDIIFGE